MATCWYILLVSVLRNCSATLEVYYMESYCGSTVDLSGIQSCLLETAMALTYPNDMNCVVTYRAPPGKRLHLTFKRFKTEEAQGKCYDFLSVFDGKDTSRSVLADSLCGELPGEPEYNSTGEHLTFEFVSDNSAKDRGFAIFILSFRPGPSCMSDEILCPSRDICIDEVNSVCDDYAHCDDGTDEAFCSGDVDYSDKTFITSIGLIAGLGLLGLATVIVVIIFINICCKKYKWNQYLKQLYAGRSLVQTRQTAAYPVTHMYQDEDYVNIDRTQRGQALVKMQGVSSDARHSENQSSEVVVNAGDSCTIGLDNALD